MLNIAICNDSLEDILEIKDIFKVLKGTCDFTSYTFSTPKELIRSLKDNHYLDIVFISTVFNLADVNAIDIIKHINAIYPHIEIIFLTSLTEQIERIFDVDFCYCILKPFTKDKFVSAIRKAINNIDKDKERPIFIPNQKARLLLNPAQIFYCERKGRTTYIHYNKEIHTTNVKLDELIDVLPPAFARPHMSYLVNLSRVKKFEALILTLDNGLIIPVSKQRKIYLKNAVNNYIQKYKVRVIK